MLKQVLMPEQENVLLCVIEECVEVAHRVSKILRFGLDETQPGFPPNRERLVGEINDLLGAIELLQEKGVELPLLGDPGAIALKKKKILDMIEYSRKQGRL
jgi:hypothetical protein